MRKQKISKEKPVSTIPFLTIDILSLFPNIFTGYLSEGLITKAITEGIVSVSVHNIRDWTHDRHRTADDKPYGGGAGMIMKVEPVVSALKELKRVNTHTILLSPRGARFDQEKARSLAKVDHLILICGHYEGVDQRVADCYADEEVSIGDYILSGGEPAAIVVVDALTRLVPGFVGNEQSLENESFEGEPKLLEFPQYTRPKIFEGHAVPDILLRGNHKEIEEWRKKKSMEITKLRRPDLINKVN